jgi:hypothetical protein
LGNDFFRAMHCSPSNNLFGISTEALHDKLNTPAGCTSGSLLDWQLAITDVKIEGEHMVWEIVGFHEF